MAALIASSRNACGKWDIAAAGRTAKEIGEELELSPKTVGSYLQRIREKFRAKDRVALIQLAIEQGLFAAAK